MEQLLIVEDDIGLNQGLCKALKADARQIISCQDLKTAKEQLLCGSVSLILLDINLPDGSGLAPVSYTHLAYLKVFTPQAGGVLYDEVRHLSCFDHLHDLFP